MPLATKLTLLNVADGSRILPAYLSDNYFSLLPGESREIDIDDPASAAQSAPQLALRLESFFANHSYSVS